MFQTASASLFISSLSVSLSSSSKLTLTTPILSVNWPPHLTTYPCNISQLVDQVISYVSRNGVAEFTTHIWKGDHYKLPSSSFSCPRLRHLNLIGCIFKPPPTFRGFSRLINLEFDKVIFAGETFNSFISSCPLLERLTLIGCFGDYYFEINAPKLKFLCFSGILNSIGFKNTRLLEVEVVHYKEGETSNMIGMFSCLPVIENLHIGCLFIKALAAGSVPKKLPTSLIHLKNLELFELNFGDLDDISCALCLIRSSPNLQKITIQMSATKDDAVVPAVEFLKRQRYSDVILDQLREVNLQLVSGSPLELEFIKLLLAKSPILEKMLIQPNAGNVADKGLRMLKDFIQFQPIRCLNRVVSYHITPIPV